MMEVRIEHYTISHQECYADNAILIAPDEDGSAKPKPQIQNKGKGLQYDHFNSEDQSIEEIMEVKSLGTTLSSYGEVWREVRDQVQKTSSLAGCINNIIW